MQVTEIVRQVIALLVAKAYDDLEILTHGVRLNAKAMATVIGNYGKKLVLPPEDGFRLMNMVEVKNAQPKQWSISMPLWTKEEGRSDLTLELTVIERQDGLRVELDDLHVL